MFKSKLKIVHVAEAFGGGVYNYILDLSNAFAKAGHKIYLVHSNRPETPAGFEADFHPDVEFIYLPMVRSPSIFKDVRCFLNLRKILKGLNPDIVHLHSSKAGALGRAAAKFNGISNRVFYSPHGLSFLRTDVSRANKKLYEVFEWLGARFGGHILSCSESEYKFVNKIIKPLKTSLLENSVKVKDIPEKYWARNSGIMIGTAGRLSAQKNYRLFLKLLDTFANELIRFLWIGGGCVETNSRDSFDIHKVPITGWLPRQQVLNKLSELDIYIQTSLWEGMPLSLIEAQVAGLPAVVTNAPGNIDVIVHGKTGFVANGEEEFISYLQILLEDAELRERMGREARRLAHKRFDNELFMKKVESLYQASV